jgi:hypothetical protein
VLLEAAWGEYWSRERYINANIYLSVSENDKRLLEMVLLAICSGSSAVFMNLYFELLVLRTFGLMLLSITRKNRYLNSEIFQEIEPLLS